VPTLCRNPAALASVRIEASGAVEVVGLVAIETNRRNGRTGKVNMIGTARRTLALAFVVLGSGVRITVAADYKVGPPRVIDGVGPGAATDYVTAGYGLDPRCRIIPSPQTTLVGDVYNFRPIAVCQSRGLYADSATIPSYWFPLAPRQ
jgi:hypothetical protein